MSIRKTIYTATATVFLLMAAGRMVHAETETTAEPYTESSTVYQAEDTRHLSQTVPWFIVGLKHEDTPGNANTGGNNTGIVQEDTLPAWQAQPDSFYYRNIR